MTASGDWKRNTTFISGLALMGALVFNPATGRAAQEDRIRGPIEGNESVVLKGNVHPGARPENDRGALDPSTRINGVKLVLGPTDRQAAELGQLLEAQRDPSSAAYQNWLQPEEYGERFGLSENDLASLNSWLQFQGFAVEQVARARNWITFSATAGQIATAFHTELRHYEVSGEKHFANASEPMIPASLAGIVTTIRGLDDFHPKPYRSTIEVHPDFDASNGSHFLAPDDLATIYDIQALYKAGFDGTGQKLAIAGQTDISIADLRAFRTEFSLPAKDPQIVLAGADPGISSGGQTEATLDLEWSGAVARNATVVYVNSQDVFESLQYAIDQDLAPVISVSYGGCEIASPTSYRTMAQQANAEGITWVNASGDSGAAGCDDGEKIATHPAAVTFPADIPEVTAVGGTELDDSGGSFWSSKNDVNLGSALSYIPEQAWNDTSLGYGLASGGGGASSIYTKPWWQTGPGVPNDQARDVPDVSLTASAAHDGYVIYAGGELMAVGGTSASSPSFAGIVTILNQYLVAKGNLTKPGIGNMNPALYTLAEKTTGLFHDVTAGNNIVPCAATVVGCVDGSYGYKAGLGYDLATGLGSVDANNLVTKWTSVPPAVGTTLALSANPASVPQSATTMLTATVSAVTGINPPTGSVAFAVGSAPLGSAETSGSGATATATIPVKGSALATGSNTITASYTATSGFSNATATATVTVTVQSIGTSIAITANPPGIVQSASTVLTATVKQASAGNIPTGPVTFTAGKTLLGTVTLAASGTAAIAALTVKGVNLVIGANSIIATYGGSTGFSGSAAIPLVVTVTPSPVATTTAVIANPAAIAQSASTVLTAMVKQASGSNIPAGSVTFTTGKTLLGTVSLMASSTGAAAVLTVKGVNLATGANSIVAAYAGSSSFDSSTATPVIVTVAPPPIATTTAVTANPAAIAESASVVLTATVKPVSGSILPTGTVVFASGSTTLGIASLAISGAAMAATLTVKGASLALGNNTITATYAGSAASMVSNGTVSVTVTTPPATTTITVTATPANIAPNTTTVLTATVKAVTGTIGPAGSVSFQSGSTLLGSATVTLSGNIGRAVLTVKGSSLTVGVNKLNATYVPVGNFSGAASSVTVNVIPAATAALK